MQPLQQIKLIITDVDGVLTDGSLYYDGNGEALKRFNVWDGLGMKMLMATGVKVAVLSGGDTPILRQRIKDLAIPYFILGKMEKRSACFELMKMANVSPEQTAYLGDDSLDLPAFEVCGLAVAVADARLYVKSQADIVLETNGGEGAFREFAEMVMTAQGNADIFNSADGFLKVVERMKMAQ